MHIIYLLKLVYYNLRSYYHKYKNLLIFNNPLLLDLRKVNHSYMIHSNLMDCYIYYFYCFDLASLKEYFLDKNHLTKLKMVFILKFTFGFWCLGWRKILRIFLFLIIINNSLSLKWLSSVIFYSRANIIFVSRWGPTTQFLTLHVFKADTVLI